MVPANPVDRTVQQAGNIGTGKKTKNIGKTKTQKKIGKTKKSKTQNNP